MNTSNGQKQATYCHHCGEQIVFNQTYPDKRNSHWAHAILVFNGKAHSLENALMEQRCADRRHWATPRRGATATGLETLKPATTTKGE